MTVKTVTVIITIKAGERTEEIRSSIGIEDLEKDVAELGKDITNVIFNSTLKFIDELDLPNLMDSYYVTFSSSKVNGET